MDVNYYSLNLMFCNVLNIQWTFQVAILVLKDHILQANGVLSTRSLQLCQFLYRLVSLLLQSVGLLMGPFKTTRHAKQCAVM